MMKMYGVDPWCHFPRNRYSMVCTTCPLCPPGPTGASGVTGPTGPTGGVPVLARGHFSLVSGSPPLTVLGGQNIVFSEANAVQNLVFTVPGESIGIQSAGAYRVGYGMLYSSAAMGRIMLRVNDNDIDYTQLNAEVQTQGDVTGEAIIQLNAGDRLSLGVGGTSITLTTIATSAFMTVNQLG